MKREVLPPPPLGIPFAPKPIPTKYGEIYFRSRLEARWYLFFQRCGVKALYEHEGYDLAGQWYLPDFWLPRDYLFVEVKPGYPTEQEQSKCERLANATGHDVLLLIGEPRTATTVDVRPSGLRFFSTQGMDGDGYYFCRCQFCSRVGFEYEGRWTRIRCGCSAEQKASIAKSSEGAYDPQPSLDAAADFANDFRFDLIP